MNFRVESIDISGEAQFFLRSFLATDKKVADANDIKSFHVDFRFNFRQVRCVSRAEDALTSDKNPRFFLLYARNFY